MSKTSERNNYIHSTQSAIINLKGKSNKDSNDKGLTPSNKKEKRDTPSKPTNDLRVRKTTVVKDNNQTKSNFKQECKIRQQDHCHIPTDLSEVPPLFAALNLCLKCARIKKEGSD